jgi:hypothetical protein
MRFLHHHRAGERDHRRHDPLRDAESFPEHSHTRFMINLHFLTTVLAECFETVASANAV